MRVLLLAFLLPMLLVPMVQAQEARASLQMSKDGHLLTPVYINNAGPFLFIVDTAASRTVISEGLAKALSLPLMENREGRLVAASGEATTRVYHMKTLGFAGQAWPLGPVLAIPDITAKHGYYGILGLDVLASQVLLLNFETGTLVLMSSKDARQRRRTGTWHKIRGDRNFAGFLSVNMRLGRNKIKAIIDSGARRSIGNGQFGLKLENLSPASIMAQEQIITGVTLPHIAARTGTVSSINLQRLRWTDAEILVADLAVFDVLGLTGQPSLILGLDFLLSTSAIMFDFAGQRLWVKPL